MGCPLSSVNVLLPLSTLKMSDTISCCGALVVVLLFWLSGCCNCGVPSVVDKFKVKACPKAESVLAM